MQDYISKNGLKVIVADPAVLPPSSFLRPVGIMEPGLQAAYSGAMFPGAASPLSGYNPHAGLPMPHMTANVPTGS